MTTWTEKLIPARFPTHRFPEISEADSLYRVRDTEQGREIQLYVIERLGLPSDIGINEFIEELREDTEHLADVTLDFASEDDHEYASLLAAGWRNATEEEIEDLLKTE